MPASTSGISGEQTARRIANIVPDDNAEISKTLVSGAYYLHCTAAGDMAYKMYKPDGVTVDPQVLTVTLAKDAYITRFAPAVIMASGTTATLKAEF